MRTVPDVNLHGLLDDLLAEGEANGGDLTPDSFWCFVAAVAQGRGIAADLHSEGMAASDYVLTSPKTTLGNRQRTSYHAAVLMRLVMGLGRQTAQPDETKRDGASLLPVNFNAGVIASDLLSMLESYPGAKAGEGQILPTGYGGQAQMRSYARRAIVGALHFRAARQGTSMAKVRDALGRSLPKKTWERWQGEVGGPKGEAVLRAKQAGSDADDGYIFNISDEQLLKFFEIAASGPGGGGSE